MAHGLRNAEGLLIECPPDTQTNQTSRNSGNAEASRSHLVFGWTLHDSLLLLAEVVHASVIAIDPKADECSRTYE